MIFRVTFKSQFVSLAMNQASCTMFSSFYPVAQFVVVFMSLHLNAKDDHS